MLLRGERRQEIDELIDTALERHGHRDFAVIGAEMADRFGPLPPEAKHLLATVAIKVLVPVLMTETELEPALAT